jgi:hypothetical protein
MRSLPGRFKDAPIKWEPTNDIYNWLKYVAVLKRALYDIITERTQSGGDGGNTRNQMLDRIREGKQYILGALKAKVSAQTS